MLYLLLYPLHTQFSDLQCLSLSEFSDHLCRDHRLFDRVCPGAPADPETSKLRDRAEDP